MVSRVWSVRRHDLHFFLKRAEANALFFGGAREQRSRVAELVFDS